MLEIEIKAYCDFHHEVVNKLKAMKARHAGIRLETDQYFNHPSRDFAVTDEALRVRDVNGKSILTYKGPKIGKTAKTRIEDEVQVDDYDSMIKILKELGFKEAGVVKKSREIYEIEDFEICIDSVEGLGDFVEIEKKGNDKDSIEKELINLARELGLEKFETRSYLELLYYKI